MFQLSGAVRNGAVPDLAFQHRNPNGLPRAQGDGVRIGQGGFRHRDQTVPVRLPVPGSHDRINLGPDARLQLEPL